MSAPVRISVVTPTHNRPASLMRLLRALGGGTLPATEFEVVVVADGCTDDTAARVRNEALPFPVTVLEQNPGRGAAAARNAGAAIATGELLVFIDDDIEPLPDMLLEHWREYRRAETATAVVGMPRPVRTPNAGLHALAMWSWWEKEFATMQQPGHRFRYSNVFSGNLAVPRTLFQQLGGFDDDFQCREDSEFGLRLLRHGARITFAPAAVGWHHELRDTAALNSRKRAEGVADVRLAKLYPQLWSHLYLALPEQRGSATYGAVRRLAFSAPRLGSLLARVLEGVLSGLETLRMRGTWRRLQAGLMYYWYWVGVARATQTLRAFEALRADCLARVQRLAIEPDIEVDLEPGVGAAEQQLDSARPGSVILRWGSLYVGRVAPDPGAEPLGGRHLRQLLAGELAQDLKNVLAAATVAGSAALRATHGPAVSIVIPAYNAGATLGATLDSLLAQTYPNWEAVVVDDGSTDGTNAVATRYATRDQRIRVVRQTNGGEGAARTSGLARAEHEWVLFLDADDTILPHALQSLTRATVEDATLDAVHGGWQRVARDGSLLQPEFCPFTGDMFAAFTRRCVLIMHSTLIKRSIARSVGDFHPSKTCADWDFWQRVARTGARFGRVNEVIAHYRLRSGSASTHAADLWRDGWRVIQQGHAPDPRVPSPKHALGAPNEQLAEAHFEFACWVAGLTIGQGNAPERILADLSGTRAPGLSPEAAAQAMFWTITVVDGRALHAWDAQWPRVLHNVEAFFRGIERQSGARLFCVRALRVLERLTLEASLAARPFTRGGTYAFAWDVSHAVPQVEPPPGVERAHCVLLAGGTRIGTFEVPLTNDSEANRLAIRREAAARYAWPVLGWFLHSGPYREIALLRNPDGFIVTRGSVTLGRGLSDREATDRAMLHDRIGWTVFLQEVWGRPDLSGGDFYNAFRADAATHVHSVTTARLTIDVGADLPALSIPDNCAALEIDLRVAGTPIGTVQLAASSGEVSVAQLRAAIVEQSAIELCRAVVREVVLGEPPNGASLRTRLVARSDRETVQPALPAFPKPPNEATPAPVPGHPFSNYDRHHFETIFARANDPWSYVTGYEQCKYEQTLALAPEGHIPRALELACAEGRFTRQLAPRVGELLAVDISGVALERARTACADLPNVQFAQLDLVSDPIPGGFDLITCSEVLYYLGSEQTLLDVGAKLRDALAPGGRLVLAHTNVVADDPNEAGLIWDVPFGAKRIGELLATVPDFCLTSEIRTDLYRIQAFERTSARMGATRGVTPVIETAPHVAPDAYLAKRFRYPHDLRGVHEAARPSLSPRLPILMYHDVAPYAANGAGAWRYRVSPTDFAAQLEYLHSAGFRSVTLADWHAAMHYRRPLPERSLIITFDDAFKSFTTHALPALQRFGFSATIFVAARYAGTTNSWDADVDHVPLLDWQEMRELATLGIEFGSHSLSHPPMTGLTNAEVLAEALESKAILERELKRPVSAFAYPYGDTDSIVQQLVAQAGYKIAVTTRFARASLNDSPMALPRVDVAARDDLATFIRNLDA